MYVVWGWNVEKGPVYFFGKIRPVDFPLVYVGFVVESQSEAALGANVDDDG